MRECGRVRDKHFQKTLAPGDELFIFKTILPAQKFFRIHTDFSVAKRFITEGYRHLEQGVRMMIVTKRKKWYQKKFIAVFGGVKIQEIDGYYVFFAEKRERYSTSEPRKRKMSKKLSRKCGHGT